MGLDFDLRLYLYFIFFGVIFKLKFFLFRFIMDLNDFVISSDCQKMNRLYYNVFIDCWLIVNDQLFWGDNG